MLIAFGINAGMFAVEMIPGISAQSAALMANALDFLGDAANYLISLAVAGLVLRWRAGSLPQAETMGVMALVANLWCAVLLWRHREGDANRRSVWICSRNDAIGNIAVVAAAAGVFGTGSAWPDITVAVILSGLGISGGLQIVRHALR